MSRIQPVDESVADQGTKDVLAEVRAKWGSSWNITSALANNPAVLDAFLALNQALDRSGLSPTDREVICMEMARTNGCHYCIPAHRFVARQKGIDAEMIDSVAAGQTLPDGSPEAVMQRLVRRLVESKGALSDADFAAFQDQGVSPPKMIAAVTEIAHCTLTNYFNRLAQTDLDPFLEAYRED